MLFWDNLEDQFDSDTDGLPPPLDGPHSVSSAIDQLPHQSPHDTSIHLLHRVQCIPTEIISAVFHDIAYPRNAFGIEIEPIASIHSFIANSIRSGIIKPTFDRSGIYSGRIAPSPMNITIGGAFPLLADYEPCAIIIGDRDFPHNTEHWDPFHSECPYNLYQPRTTDTNGVTPENEFKLLYSDLWWFQAIPLPPLEKIYCLRWILLSDEDLPKESTKDWINQEVINFNQLWSIGTLQKTARMTKTTTSSLTS